jgi:exosortase
MNTMTDRAASPVRVTPLAAALAVALGALTLWAFWPPLVQMAHQWMNDPQYTHGYLVPLFSAYLLWARRGRLAGAKLSPSWLGLLPLAAAALLRYEASRNYDYFDGVALVLTIAGFFLLAGGPRALVWSWPAVAFLLFMVPLPYSVEHAVAGPLQRLATVSSTYIMQTIGLPALAEGNVIVLGNGRVEVEQACSGLSMLMIFFALSTAMAILVRRPLLDRILILVAAAPIAILANVFRITATGLAQEWFGAEAAHKIFHDWAGWMMMPLALAMLWLLLGVLSLVLREQKEDSQVPLNLDGPMGLPGGLAGQSAPGPKNPRSVREGPPAGPPSASRGGPPVGPTPINAVGS